MNNSTYQKYRETRVTILETLRKSIPNGVIVSSTKILGWKKKRPSTLEQTFIRDYALHEYGSKDTAVITSLTDDVLTTEDERTFFKALKEATTSFFIVTESNESENTVVIDDLLHENITYSLNKADLPEDCSVETILFLRPISLANGVVHSGICFQFDSSSAERIASELHYQEKGREKLSSKELFSFALSIFIKYGVASKRS